MGFGSGVLSSFLYDFLHALFKLRGRPGLRAKWEHRTNRTVDGSELCVSATISKGRTQLMTKNRGGGSPARVTVFRRFKYSLHLHSRIRQCYFDLAVL